MIRRGVPFSLRARVWYVISGAEELERAAGPRYYQSVLDNHYSGGEVSTSVEEIERDVHRTYPEHPYLQTEEGLGCLRRVLLAFSIHNTEVGYCQSLNFLVGFLMIVFEQEREEKVFWALVATIQYKVHPQTYQRDLRGCHVEQRVLKELIDRKLPRLGAHLDRVHCDMVMLTTEWFMCLFLHCLPIEVAARVWDVLMSEGAKVIFRVGLAFFKILHDDLLACTDLTEIISLMRESLLKLYDADELMRTAFNEIGSLSMDTILYQRKTKGKAVNRELDARAERVKMFSSFEDDEGAAPDVRLDANVSDNDDDTDDESKGSGQSTPRRGLSAAGARSEPSGAGAGAGGNPIGSTVKKELTKIGRFMKKGVTATKNSAVSAIKNVRSLKEVKPSTMSSPAPQHDGKR